MNIAHSLAVGTGLAALLCAAQSPGEVVAESARTPAPTSAFTARCEGLSELLAALERDRDATAPRDAKVNVGELLDRHAAGHGWLPWGVNDVDLVDPEHGARCDPKLLDDLPRAYGEAAVEKLWTAQKIAKLLERNGRGGAAIEFATSVLAQMKAYDDSQRSRRGSWAPIVEGQLAWLYFRAGEWRAALEHYQRWGENHDTSTAMDSFAHAKDHQRCRCLLELGSFDVVIAIATAHVREGSAWLEGWIAYDADFADELALAQLLSGHRSDAEATLASTHDRSKGQYTMQIDVLERCWSALHSDGAGADVRELASCAISGCDRLAAQLLIRGGRADVEPLLPIFSLTDTSIATRRLQLALMDTGEACVLEAIKAAYDATTDKRVQQFLDDSIRRWRDASAVRVQLERR